MKGEIDIHRYPSRKYRCECWTLTLYGWEFPLNSKRRRMVAEAKAMEGFIGFCDPHICTANFGNVFFMLFDSKKNAAIAGNYIYKKYRGQHVGKNLCRHYAACNPVKRGNTEETCGCYVDDPDDPKNHAILVITSEPVGKLIHADDESDADEEFDDFDDLFDDDSDDEQGE